MAIRTNTTAVAEELGYNYAPADGKRLDRWIRKANSVVDRVVTCATAKGFTHTATELAEMENSLACYFYTLMDPMYSSKSTSGASGSFLADAENYLKMAKALDGSGCLAAIMAGARAGATWMGRAPSAQTPYAQRD